MKIWKRIHPTRQVDNQVRTGKEPNIIKTMKQQELPYNFQ
jgi:hypothetical protein